MAESKMNKLEQAARQVVDAWDLGEFSTRMDETITALREALAEQEEQEPVCIDWDTKTDEPIMGYAAPVRTKDLTDDEIAVIVDNCTSDDNGYDIWCDGHAVARAVIAADREKNNV